MDKKIPTYVINLEKRRERKEHILNEFIDKPEFEVKVVEAIEHTNGTFPIFLFLLSIHYLLCIQ